MSIRFIPLLRRKVLLLNPIEIRTQMVQGLQSQVNHFETYIVLTMWFGFLTPT